MSFFYFLQPQLNSFTSMQSLFYIPSQVQQATPNLVLIAPTHTSQIEEKQNFILQSNAVTRESLHAESEERPKNPKKKRVPKKEKDESFGWRNQNKDRNILSNILKAFINFILEHGGMRTYLAQLSQRLRLQSGVSDFCEHLASQFPPNKSYISPKLVAQMLKDPKLPIDFTTTLRYALDRFLRMDYTLVLLKSSKIKKRSKLEQMKRSRELRDILFGK